MVPDIAKKGHSFKGALAYYLHDKGKDTTERIGWTETRNLMTDDPQQAKKIMIATALQSDELKKQAGIKAAGRKSNQHVYAYALSWHPDEAGTLDKDQMMQAVESSLKELQADHLQAIVVCHTDQKHPHVHVVLNRVDPSDGRMHPFKNDRLKLSDWANKYERERGLIVTPAREEKRKKREQYADKKARQEFALAKRQEANARAKDDLSPAAMLKDLGEAQKLRHRQEWKELSATNKANRNAIYNRYRNRIYEAAALHKKETKPFWRDHFKNERDRKKAYDNRETNILGVVQNAMAATAHQHIRGELDGKGKLSATFSNVLSSQKRRTVFENRLDIDRRSLSKQLKNILDDDIKSIQEKRLTTLKKQRADFGSSRENLIKKQDEEWAKVREAWSQLRTRPASGGRGSGGKVAEDPHARRSKKRLEILSPKNEARNQYLDRRAGRAAMKKPRAQQKELDPLKKDFAQKAPEKTAKPKKQATRTATVATPSPAPSPSGEVPRSTAARQTVPAKDWSKSSTTTKSRTTKPAKQDWMKTGASKPLIQEPKDWSKKAERAGAKPTWDKASVGTIVPPKDWSKKADKPKTIREVPPIKRDLDRSR